MLSEADRKLLATKGVAPSRAFIDEREIKLLERVAVILAALSPQVKDLNRRVVLNRLSRELDSLKAELGTETSREIKAARESAWLARVRMPPAGSIR